MDKLDNLDPFVIAFKRAGIVLDSVDQQKQLAEYGASVLEINENLNITGAKDAWELTSKHLADVFYALTALEKEHKLAEIVWDIGSGGGIPGIPLAIMRPQTQVVMVERRQKKALAIEELADYSNVVDQVEVHAETFEKLKPFPKNAQFWFRGVMPGPKMISYLSQNFGEDDLDEIVLMKGPNWEVELQEALKEPKIKPYWRNRFAQSRTIPYELPENVGKRVLVLI